MPGIKSRLGTFGEREALRTKLNVSSRFGNIGREGGSADSRTTMDRSASSAIVMTDRMKTSAVGATEGSPALQRWESVLKKEECRRDNRFRRGARVLSSLRDSVPMLTPIQR
jgi:hypothetical protein